MKERELPASTEAERGLIGSWCFLPEVYDDVSEIRPEMYTDPMRGTFWKHAGLYPRGMAFDAHLFVAQLRAAGDFKPEMLAELGHCADSVINAAHAKHYAGIVREKYQRRELIAAAIDLQRAAYDDSEPTEGIISGAEKRLLAIEETGCPLTIATAKNAASQAVERIFAAKQGHGSLGLATGIDDYDRLAGGFYGGELIVLAARPGDGKTSLATQIAVYGAEREQRALIVTCEMGASELALRSIAGDATVRSVDIRAGTLTDDELDRLVQAADAFGALPLHLLDLPTASVAHIRRAAKQLKRKAGLSLVVCDYLGLLAPTDRRIPRHEQIGQLTRDLKALARDLDLPLLLLAQLNREAANAKNGKPKLSQLRESGNIEQDADVVLFLHRPEAANPKDPDVQNVVELIVAKNRNGPTFDTELYFDRERTRFGTLTRRYQEFDVYNGDEGG
jgi:replicative DNA helicase